MANDGAVTVADPAGLVRALEASGRFRRDTRLGRIFHPGEISFRESSPTNSLHVTISGNRVRAHVDEVSPLYCAPDGTTRYAWSRVLAHNLASLVEDLGRRVRGRHGEQRCDLQCEAVWFDDGGEAGLEEALLEGACGMEKGEAKPEQEPPSHPPLPHPPPPAAP